MASGKTPQAPKRKPRRELSKKQRRERDIKDMRGQTRRQDLEFPPAAVKLADTSKRDFFHMTRREEKRWHEMLADAPTEYSIHWIDELLDPKLRAYLRQAYIQIRQEQDTGKGVSFLRDILIRRLLWCARIAQRIEGQIEYYSAKDMVSSRMIWANRLAKAERYYTHLTEVMIDICFHLHRTGPKPKKQRGTSAGRVGTGTVQIPTDEQ